MIQDYHRAVEEALRNKSGNQTQEQRHHNFSDLFLERKFREAIRLVCERDTGEGGRVYYLTNGHMKNQALRIKTSRKYWRKKFRTRKTLGVASEVYEETPVFIAVNITEEVVESVARNI